MAIRCSVLGHDFGDPEREREREDRGGEVVVTTREVEICRSCGEERTVSESKEVTSAAGGRPDPSGSSTSDATSPPTADATDTRERSGADGRGPTDDRSASVSGTEDRESSADGRIDAGAETGPAGRGSGRRPTADAAERESDATERESDTTEREADDAIEYDLDEAGIVDRDGGERGANEPTGGDPAGDEPPENEPVTGNERATEREPATGNEPAARDRSTTGERAADDPDGIDRIGSAEGSARDGSSGRAHGEWPAEPGSRADPATEPEQQAEGSEHGPTGWDSPIEGGRDDSGWSPPGEGPAAGGADRIPSEDATEGAFVCPACGFAEPVTASALRAGDICPECRQGYLSWETRKG